MAEAWREKIDYLKKKYADQRSAFADLVVSLEAIHWLGLPKDSKLGIQVTRDQLRVHHDGEVTQYELKDVPDLMLAAIIERQVTHWDRYSSPMNSKSDEWIRAARKVMHNRKRSDERAKQYAQHVERITK